MQVSPAGPFSPASFEEDRLFAVVVDAEDVPVYAKAKLA